MGTKQADQTGGAGLTLSQLVLQARLMRPALIAEGLQRQRAAGSKDNKASQGRHRTREVLGRFCGLSGRSFDKALHVIDAAENDPERYARVIEQLDSTGNIERAFHAVVFAEMRRDRIQAPIFSETKIGKRRLGYFTARELAWLIRFFAELGKHFDPAASGYACDVFTEAQVQRAVRRAEGSGRLPPKAFAQRGAKRGARNA